jgi:hypothetical protein
MNRVQQEIAMANAQELISVWYFFERGKSASILTVLFWPPFCACNRKSTKSALRSAFPNQDQHSNRMNRYIWYTFNQQLERDLPCSNLVLRVKVCWKVYRGVERCLSGIHGKNSEGKSAINYTISSNVWGAHRILYFNGLFSTAVGMTEVKMEWFKLWAIAIKSLLKPVQGLLYSIK